jgi:hypothetical protein
MKADMRSLLFLLLCVVTNASVAEESPITALMAYDLNACNDVVFGRIEFFSESIIDKNDPLLNRVREFAGKIPNSNLMVGVDGALTAGKYAPDYRFYCFEQFDEADTQERTRKQIICYQESGLTFKKIVYKPTSKFDSQFTFQCTTNCGQAPFARIFEMVAGEEGYDLIPAHVKEIQRFRNHCK